MKNNHGFTLVELIATISIIAVIATISTFAYVKLLRDQQEKDYNANVALVENAAKRYGDEHKDLIKSKGDAGHSITICQLMKEDYLESDDDNFYTVPESEMCNYATIKNPKTGNKLDLLIKLKYKIEQKKINDITRTISYVEVTIEDQENK